MPPRNDGQRIGSAPQCLPHVRPTATQTQRPTSLPLLAQVLGSGFSFCPERPDEAQQRGSACRTTPGYSYDCDNPHVLGEAQNGADTNNYQHCRDGQVSFRPLHSFSPSLLISRLSTHSILSYSGLWRMKQPFPTWYEPEQGAYFHQEERGHKARGHKNARTGSTRTAKNGVKRQRTGSGLSISHLSFENALVLQVCPHLKCHSSQAPFPQFSRQLLVWRMFIDFMCEIRGWDFDV